MKVARFLAGTLIMGLFILVFGCSQSNGLPAEEPPQQPAPRAVPRNASQVLAKLLEFRDLSQDADRRIRLPGRGRQVVARYAIKVEVTEVSPLNGQTRSMARPNLTVEAWSDQTPPTGALGKDIQAVMILTGETGNVRWWVSEIQLVPE